ncbi:MAG: DUF58 domain-containing protein [Chloroflexota bacterium]|nr:DUF58 domain-containing protein [Chloroflexota bacterium]
MSALPFLILLLLVLAVLMRLDFVYYLIYVCGGIWLLSRWATPRSLSALRVGRKFVDHAFLGETIPVSLELVNSTWLPMPWVRVNETLPLDLSASRQIRRVFTLRPREHTSIHYDLHCSRRGFYPIGPMQLTSGDLFGFSDVRARDEGQQFLTVYPRIIPLANLAVPSRLPFGTLSSTRRMFEDPARPRGVREYQSGDSLRRINWKASAHAENLLVKQFSPAISLESMVFLNLNAAEYSRQRRYGASEWAIVVAASVASYLERARQSVGLATNGSDPLITLGMQTVANSLDLAESVSPAAIPARPGRQHLMKVLEILARVEVMESKQPFAVWAQRAAIPLSWGTTVIAITPNADEAACRGLHALVRAGLNVVMLAVEPYGQFGLIRERARRLGFVACRVATEQDLETLQVIGGPSSFRRMGR